MRTFKIALVVLAGFLGMLVCGARADVQTIGASKDNTLYQSATGNLSNGTGSGFFAGMTNDALLRRGLIEFDVAGSIPAGSVVTAVSLQLHCSRTKAQSTNVQLRLAFAEWGEGASVGSGEGGQGAPAASGDATWLHTFYPSSFWSSAGGDFSGTASATTSVWKDGQTYTWSSAQMVADVQVWLSDPALNHGWFVIGSESGSHTAKRFTSRNSTDIGHRPQLTITYTPPANTGACCIADGTCSTVTPTQCTNLGGVYQGNGTSCTPNPCPQPTGACCSADGSCDELTLAQCSAIGGTWQGAGTDCSPNPCPQPAGACCFPDGSCASLDAGACASQGGVWQGAGTSCASTSCPLALAPFVDPLPRPAIAQPVSGVAGGAADYQIAMRRFTQQLHRDLPPTLCYGYGGTYPGPTIEAASGQPVTVQWINDLRDGAGALLQHHDLAVDTCLHGPDMAGDAPRTVVHLHGSHVPVQWDGYPEATFLPGQAVSYLYPNEQLPATLWYHDHALGITRLNVMMGLAGFYLLRDTFEQALNLPAGEFEIPLAIQDRSFELDGSLKYPANWDEHFFGDTILVNGKVWPYLQVKRGLYRFRLLNGCNSRTLALSLSNGATIQQIGTEGGLLPAPVPLASLTLSPGERADVVIDFASYAPNSEIVLQNNAPAPYPGSPGVGVVPNVMKFVVIGGAGWTAPLPTALRPIERLVDMPGLTRRSLELRKVFDPCTGSSWRIDGLGWHDITEFPLLGTTEVWSFVNRSGVVHPMHLHLVMFQVLDRQAFDVVNGVVVPTGPRVQPSAEEQGWKDTVKAQPNQITRVIMRFEDYAGRYPYHCHVLEHEDQEMMRQFEVIDRPRVPHGWAQMK